MTLQQIRDLLASSSVDDALLEQKVKQAKHFVHQNFPSHTSAFDQVAIEPSQIENNFVWPGGSKSEFDLFVQNSVEAQRQNIESHRLMAVAFLDALLKTDIGRKP